MFLHPAPDDYAPVSGTFTFPAGETRYEIPQPIEAADDDLNEPDEMLTAMLSNPGEGLMTGPDDTAMIVIMDTDGK